MPGKIPFQRRQGEITSMNLATFTDQLNRLETSDWQAVVEGQGILVIDDLCLRVGSVEAPNAIICAPAHGKSTADALKRDSLANAGSLLNNYYLTHPLTLLGFNHQAEALIEAHGAAAFLAMTGQLPERTLFVAGGEVIAEPPDSPRHRYGVYCELLSPLADSGIRAQVRKWLDTGEAHERYLGMNVCRYNC